MRASGFCLRLATMGSLGFAEARKQSPTLLDAELFLGFRT
jgi:hypothetical protein